MSYSDVTRGNYVNKLHEVKYLIMCHRIGHPAGKMFVSNQPNMAQYTYDIIKTGDKFDQQVSNCAYKLE